MKLAGGRPGVAQRAEVGQLVVAQAQPGTLVGDLTVETLEAGAALGRAPQ